MNTTQTPAERIAAIWAEYERYVRAAHRLAQQGAACQAAWVFSDAADRRDAAIAEVATAR